MRLGGDVAADLLQVQAHGARVGIGQDESGAGRAPRADRAEQVGPGVAAVARGARGRVPRRARTRVSVPCWPTRASSWDQTSIGLPAVRPGSACLTSSAKLFLI